MIGVDSGDKSGGGRGNDGAVIGVDSGDKSGGDRGSGGI